MKLRALKRHALGTALAALLVMACVETPPAGDNVSEIDRKTQVPGLAYVAYEVNDSVAFSPQNNGDGIAQPGESIRLVVKLKNEGDLVRTGVRGELISNSACTTVTPEFSDLSYNDTPAY